MRKVWKYPLPITDTVALQMPTGAVILDVQVQTNTLNDTLLFMWALVDPGASIETRRFRIAGTGHPIDGAVEHIASVQLAGGELVFHVFEAIEP